MFVTFYVTLSLIFFYDFDKELRLNAEFSLLPPHILFPPMFFCINNMSVVCAYDRGDGSINVKLIIDKESMIIYKIR